MNTLKISDTLMEQPTHPTTTASNKVAKLDLFHRERYKLKDWLLQFNLYFKFKDGKIDDDNKACLVALYMRGTAARWVKPHLMKYMDEGNHDD